MPTTDVASFGAGFESFFCRPGIEGAREKGGVEGEIGSFRRRRRPRRRSGDHRPPDHHREAFAEEAGVLMGLATEAFDYCTHWSTIGPEYLCGNVSTPCPPATRDDAARRARDDATGTRALVAILLAHRSMPGAALIVPVVPVVALAR